MNFLTAAKMIRNGGKRTTSWVFRVIESGGKIWKESCDVERFNDSSFHLK